MTAFAFDAGGSNRRTNAWPKRITVGTLATAIVLAAAFVGWTTVTKAMIAAQHPAPGRMVDIGGYRLHLDCAGPETGSTVLLEAGNADFSVFWSKVRPQIAQTTRVCSYDRAGLGWSERGPQPRTLAAMNGELDALLANSGIDGPLLLVGHSFGAILARDFARRHLGRVVGMVLVDPAHPDQLARIPAMAQLVEQSVEQFEGVAPLAQFGLLAIAPGNIPNRGLPDAAQADYAAILATTDYFSVAAEETAALPTNLTALQDGVDLSAMPLIVISRGQPEAAAGMDEATARAFEAEWAFLQRESVGLSQDGRQVIAGKSGHYVQLTEPELIVAAVSELLD
jgi:pimeloyl-ACP methyl ester carboxylesterase